jgi:hypothetical protein
LNDLNLIPIDWTEPVEMDCDLSLSRSNSMFHKFSHFWDLKTILGAGSFGLVASVVEVDTGRKLALKIAEWD